MPLKTPAPDLTDPDNPEWTAEDFARAQGPESLPPEILAAFPKTRGRPKSEETKEPISLRLDAGLARHLRDSGPGWQTRVNDILAASVKAGKL